jgi:Uma2 family endonuclease
MSSLPLARLSPQEFLEWERNAEQKHEYWDGEVFAMAGGSPAHSLVIGNVQVALGRRLDASPCFVFNADLRVAVRWGELITYPDITVLCEEPQYFDSKEDTLTNPTLIVEVLSPSTKKTDRTEKSFMYREIPSMREILLVDPAPTMIEHYWKLPNGHWELETVRNPGAAIALVSLDQQLPVSEIYRKVDLLSRSLR